MATYTGTDNSENVDNGWNYDVFFMLDGDDLISQTYDSDYFGLYQTIPSTVTTPGVWASYFTPAENDRIDMGDGDDWLSVGAGQDVLDGGAGFDMLALSANPPTDPRMWVSWGRNATSHLDSNIRTKIDLKAGTLSATGYTIDLTVVQLTVYGQPGTNVTFSQSGVGAYSHSISGFEAVGGTAGTDIMKGSGAAFELFNIGLFNGGNDRIDGRGGFDLVTYNSIDGFVLADLSKGTSTVYSTSYGNTTQTLRNVEGLGGSKGMDFLYGDGGDNLFFGSRGADHIEGGAGRDTLAYDLSEFNARLTAYLGAPSGVEVDLAGGRATVSGEVGDLYGIEDVIGSKGGDTLTGDIEDNFLDGRIGDDLIRGGVGRDTVVGGAGDDTMEGNANWDVLDYSQETGAFGINVTLKNNTALDTFGDTDSVRGFEEIIGTDLKDLIKGDDASNLIRGGDGRDNLGGLAGKDTIYGDKGRDAIGGGEDADILDGGDDDDTIFGNAGRDVLFGGKGDDQLFGGNDADDIFGGRDDDQIKDSADETNPGQIYLFVNNLRDLLRQGGDVIAATQANVTTNHLDGGRGDDTVLGFGLLDGGDDNDVIRGGGVLHGGDGDDLVVIDATYSAGGVDYGILIGGRGNDTIDGGNTHSIVDYSYASHAVVADLQSGTANAGNGDKDRLIGIDNLHGSRFDDILKDAASKFGSLEGGEGNDRILLRVTGSSSQTTSRDYASGGNGNDTIATAGNDGWATIHGDDGDDVIQILHPGNAEAWGDRGNDKFDIRSGGEFHGNGDNDTFLVRATSGGVVMDGDANRDTFIFKTGASAGSWVDGGSGRDVVKIEGGIGAGLDISIRDFVSGEDHIKIAAPLAQSFDTQAEYLAHAKLVASGSATDLLVVLGNGAHLTFEDMTLAEVPFSSFSFF